MELKKIKILSIKKTEDIAQVYDISVQKNHNFFIGSGILTHNCDFMTANSQAALRNLMETFSKNARFILTCNYVEKIIEPIQSRCVAFHIIPPNKVEVAKRCAEILNKEGITFEKSDLVTVINKSYPDMRRIINTLQSVSKTGSIKIDSQVKLEANYMDSILEELKTFKDPKTAFINIRKIIADSKVRTFEELYRFLYENLDSFAANGKMGTTILIIAKAAQHDALVVDREINIMAMFVEILTELKS